MTVRRTDASSAPGSRERSGTLATSGLYAATSSQTSGSGQLFLERHLSGPISLETALQYTSREGRYRRAANAPIASFVEHVELTASEKRAPSHTITR
jgi:hypothetical protein